MTEILKKIRKEIRRFYKKIRIGIQLTRYKFLKSRPIPIPSICDFLENYNFTKQDN